MPRFDSRSLSDLRAAFAFPTGRMRTMIASFQSEMERGLRGAPSSLRMLPAYIDNPTGREKGSFLALDLGGTNFRVLRVDLRGDGRPPRIDSEKFRLTSAQVRGDAGLLFGTIARAVGSFLAGRGGGVHPLGFTFSFPIRQLTIDRGKLIKWSKEWSAAGVEGRDVVALLNAALSRENVAGVRVVSLNNDTTGTQVARAYLDRDCDTGYILGTGTNLCYREKTASIRKPLGAYDGESMIINTESGNFNKELPRNSVDERLDADSENPGDHWAEKMVSGKYLGEIVRLVAAGLAREGRLFGGRLPGLLAQREGFGSELVGEIVADRSPDASATRAFLRRVGVARAAAADAVALREIAGIISVRAARIAAAVLAAAVTKNDPGLKLRHVVAVDGSVYEKHPRFKETMAATFAELFGRRAGRIAPELTHDGSGLGAAVIAAVAVSRRAAAR